MVKKHIKMGKLPIDVRSSDTVPAFENMLSRGPMTIILVYADWCGHCDTFKKNIWKPLNSTPNRTMNMASVHYDQLENTSLKNSAINGYPSLLVVGTDGEPATFESENGTTNAMPDANNMRTMKRLVTTPVSNMRPKENNVGLPTSTALSTNSSNFQNSSLSPPLANRNNLNLSPIRTSTLSANTTNVSPNNGLNSLNLSSNNSANAFNAENGANAFNAENGANAFNAENGENAFNAENGANGANAENGANAANINDSMLSMNESLPPNLEEDSLNAYEGATPRNSAVEINTASNIPRNVRTGNAANTQGTTPILSGGRLYRTLTTKNRRLRRVKTAKRKRQSRQSKRKN